MVTDALSSEITNILNNIDIIVNVISVICGYLLGRLKRQRRKT